MITTRITEGYMVDAYTRKALGDRLLRQYARRKAMLEDGTTQIRHFAMLDRAISATVTDLIDLGAGAKLIAILRERRR